MARVATDQQIFPTLSRFLTNLERSIPLRTPPTYTTKKLVGNSKSFRAGIQSRSRELDHGSILKKRLIFTLKCGRIQIA